MRQPTYPLHERTTIMITDGPLDEDTITVITCTPRGKELADARRTSCVKMVDDFIDGETAQSRDVVKPPV